MNKSRSREGTLVVSKNDNKAVILTKARIYVINNHKRAIINVPVPIAEKFNGKIVKVTIEKLDVER